jgi:antitoxin component YwqK of YwqJK toxin-antitoxin module
MRARPLPHLFMLCLCVLGAPAGAVEDCSVKGESVNLDNGNTTAKLTGVVRCVDRDTKKEVHTVSFKNGQKDGWEVRRWPDGSAVEQEYRAGKRHGGFKRFEEGRLVETARFADDNARGEEVRYHPNGKVSRRIDRQPEDAQSTFEDFDETGRLMKAGCGLQSSREAGLENCPWKGPNPLVFFHSNGQKRAVIPMKNGLRQGVTETFDAKGQRVNTTAFSAGLRDGLTTVYGDGGAIRRSVTWVQGRQEGDETEYFLDGTKATVITWKDRRQHKRVEYFQNGERKREFVLTGERAVDSTFDDNGTLRERQNQGMRDGRSSLVPDGLTETFHPDGGVESRVNYVQGDREGRRQEWAENGVLVEDSQWKKDRVTARKRWNPDGGLVEDDTFYEDGSRKKK